ncbi:MAG: DUF3892 domain-containing protein [Desulfobulbaceae bacterium]|nr:DUF3892 domain-containing protein [Desulfobulbaceae bacterium]
MDYNPRQKLIETRLSESEFKQKLCVALAGGKELKRVVWTVAENEIIVDLNKLQVAVRVGKIVVGLSLECDEFGPQELVIPFVVGDAPENSFLLAVMPKSFGGHQGLARTWGEVSAKFVWQACVDSLQMKWRQEDGMQKFRVQGLIGRNEMVQGLFTYPDEDEFPEDENSGSNGFADIIDSLELAQIHLGLWSKGPLVPVEVGKVGGKVDTVKFQNGVVMKSAEVAALVKKKKVKVTGVTAVQRGGKYFLRTKPDKKTDNNLLNLPPIKHR